MYPKICITQIPVEELASGLVSHLPLKSMSWLYSAGHSVTPQCIPKIVESAPHFTTAHNVDKTKVSAQPIIILEQSDFPLLRIAPLLAFHAFGSRNVEAEQLGSILALPVGGFVRS